MRLGEFIQTLEAMPSDAIVKFAGDDANPNGLCSWRGSYDNLTLDRGAQKPQTVADVLKDAREAVGNTFQGYKGGDFTMDGDTVVWADSWGESRCTAITGVYLANDIVRINTAMVEDYVHAF